MCDASQEIKIWILIMFLANKERIQSSEWSLYIDVYCTPFSAVSSYIDGRTKMVIKTIGNPNVWMFIEVSGFLKTFLLMRIWGPFNDYWSNQQFQINLIISRPIFWSALLCICLPLIKELNLKYEIND